MYAIRSYYVNIIGSRMREHPEATLRLVGTNSDEGAEQADTALSRSRAVSVRDYLAGTWGIAANRMRIEARNLPEKPSNIGEIDGIQENRRVESYNFV